MWRAIRANKMKSLILIISMGVFLLALGGFAGWALGGPRFVSLGVAVSGFVWFVLTYSAVFEGDGIFILISGAREVSRETAPQLHNVVEEMAIAAALPKIPRALIVESAALNAFAVGSPESSAIAVTRGLLCELSREELQGVIAHETGHIKNQDTKFMAVAGVTLGVIVIISDLLSRVLAVKSVAESESCAARARGMAGRSRIFLMGAAVLAALLAPLLANIIYLACSRSREYLADASAALFTRCPEGLASALEKIASVQVPLDSASRVTAPMYIVNPLELAGEEPGFMLLSTHPRTEERVRILRSMYAGPGLFEYNEAFKRVKGRSIFSMSSMRPEAERKLRGL